MGQAMGSYSGVFCFFLGWAGIFFDGIAAIGWFANIFLIPTLIVYAKNRSSSFILSLIALLLALSSFLYKVVGDIDGGIDESHIIGSYGSGFYCWLSVYVILTIVTSIQLNRMSDIESQRTNISNLTSLND